MCWELIDGEVGLQLKEDLAIMKSQNALNPRCREIIQFARESGKIHQGGLGLFLRRCKGAQGVKSKGQSILQKYR